jgi:G:T-mismatch repair DNA endonuclease (very short patch repair protein)
MEELMVAIVSCGVVVYRDQCWEFIRPRLGGKTWLMYYCSLVARRRRRVRNKTRVKIKFVVLVVQCETRQRLALTELK